MITPFSLLLVALLWAALYAALRRWRGRGSALAEAVGAGGLVALFTAAFFWQILLVPGTWMPAGGGDLASFLYPNYRFAAEQLRQGILPLWNPYLYTGSPFAADVQSGLFYPPNLLLFALLPALRYEHLLWLVIAHFWLAGTGMYVCLRHLHGPERLAPLAALAGALAWEFSDLFIVHLGNLNLIAVAAWLPLIFLAFHRATVRRSAGWAAGAGALLAVATLAGHAQITLFLAMTLGLWALWALWGDRGTGQALRHRLRPLLLLALTGLVTGGLAALMLLPAWEMSGRTPRALLDYPTASQYSLHPAQLVSLIAPGIFGRDPALFWGPWERVPTGYLGILPLLLAGIGALRGHGPLPRFFVGLAALALLLALGPSTPLHGWFYALVPGFDQLRAPSRLVLLMDFGLAALAAQGLHTLMSGALAADNALWRGLRRVGLGLAGLLLVALPLAFLALLLLQVQDAVIFGRAARATEALATLALLAGASFALLYGARAGRLRGQRLGWAAVALIALDLCSLGSNVDVGHSDPTANFRNPETLAALQADPGLHRIEALPTVWGTWQPDSALLYGLYEVGGLYNPLVLADPERLRQAAQDRRGPLYNLMGVKYILAPQENAPLDGEPGGVVAINETLPGLTLYLNQRALPRLLFVGEAVVVADQEAAWQSLNAPSFDPARQVVVEGAAPAPPSTPQATLGLLAYGLHELLVQVETDAPGFLVLSDAWYPGWQATVDGEAVPLLRANYAFRAVAVPAGSHRVAMRFQPQSWALGLTLSLLSAGALGLWGLVAAHRRRAATGPSG